MYYLGVDLGGTNIFVGLVDENGKIISKESTPTISVRSADLILDDLIALCKKVVAENNLELSDVEYVGIGVPGVVNRETGVLEYANNLNFNHTNIAEYVGKALGLPVYLENDANCAAIGEITAGANNVTAVGQASAQLHNTAEASESPSKRPSGCKCAGNRYGSSAF